MLIDLYVRYSYFQIKKSFKIGQVLPLLKKCHCVCIFVCINVCGYIINEKGNLVIAAR